MTDVTPIDDARPPIEFVKNGTVRLHVGGRVVRLRRPKMGELRELRERLWEATDTIADLTRELQEEANRLKEQAEGNGDVAAIDKAAALAEWRRFDREGGRKLVLAEEAQYLSWFQFATDTLSQDDPLDVWTEEGPGEDAEPWMGTLAFVGDLFRHFQTVPLGHGQKP